MKKIGIIGSGDVGKALAIGFASEGHPVMVGSRSPESDELTKWKKESGLQIASGTFADAAEFGAIIVLAIGWQHIDSAIELTGEMLLDTKVIIDVTNPLDFSNGFPPRLAVSGDNSGGEQIQARLKNAQVVKAFNIVGNGSMYKPDYSDGDPTMWICGNDDQAKEVVIEILHKFGWKEVVDIGGIEGARLLEPLCILWVMSGNKLENWHIAFKLLQK